jgi:hypothetical protein
MGSVNAIGRSMKLKLMLVREAEVVEVVNVRVLKVEEEVVDTEVKSHEAVLICRIVTAHYSMVSTPPIRIVHSLDRSGNN